MVPGSFLEGVHEARRLTRRVRKGPVLDLGRVPTKDSYVLVQPVGTQRVRAWPSPTAVPQGTREVGVVGGGFGKN